MPNPLNDVITKIQMPNLNEYKYISVMADKVVVDTDPENLIVNNDNKYKYLPEYLNDLKVTTAPDLGIEYAGQAADASIVASALNNKISFNDANPVYMAINDYANVSSSTSGGQTITTRTIKTGVLPTNTKTTDGIVSAPTASNANKIWKTDASGDPGWRNGPIKIFTSITVATNKWSIENNPTYASFPYKATITNLTGITSNTFARVVFNPDDATSGNFASVCLTGANQVTIYARKTPTNTITIPTIIVWEG